MEAVTSDWVDDRVQSWEQKRDVFLVSTEFVNEHRIKTEKMGGGQQTSVFAERADPFMWDHIWIV